MFCTDHSEAGKDHGPPVPRVKDPRWQRADLPKPGARGVSARTCVCVHRHVEGVILTSGRAGVEP